jgi:hypothetical protein
VFLVHHLTVANSAESPDLERSWKPSVQLGVILLHRVLGGGVVPPSQEAFMFSARVRWGSIGFWLVATACTAESGGGSDPGAEGHESLGNAEFTCCINDVGYTCPDEDAFDQCMGFDIQECTSGCAFGDSACNDACFDQWAASEPNPEGCEEDPNADCSSDSGGTCGGTAIPCDLDLDCCEGLVCGPRQDGQPGGSCQ